MKMFLLMNMIYSQQTKDLNAQTQSLSGSLMDTVNTNMVTGQAAVTMDSPSLNLTVDKSFTESMTNSKFLFIWIYVTELQTNILKTVTSLQIMK